MEKYFLRQIKGGLLIGLLALGCGSFHGQLYQQQLLKPKLYPAVWPGEFLNKLSMGYRNILADVAFLKGFARQLRNEKDWEYFYQACQQSTTIDPRFTYPYETGGILLAWEAHRYDLSNALLEKGMQNLPENYLFPLWRAFNAYYFLADYASASDYYNRAWELCPYPATKTMLKSMAIRFTAAQGKPEEAWKLLFEFAEQTQDKALKEQLQKGLKHYMNQIFLLALNSKLHLFYDIHKQIPESVDELIKAQLLNQLPEDPWGYPYRYNKNKFAFENSHDTH